MQLAKLVIVYLTLNTRCSVGITLDTFEPKQSSSVLDAVVHVLKSCYGNRVNTVGLAGDSLDILIRKLSSETYVSVTLLDNTNRVANNNHVSRRFRYQLKVFVATASSTTRLKEILDMMKVSLWWNPMASLFIIDWLLAAKHGWSDASDMLKAAWKMDVLHAKFICVHPSRGRLMYSYNPYTGYAPDPWKVANIYTDLDDHPWTLFVRSYDNASRICEQLDYDKTTNVGVYPITSFIDKNLTSLQLIPNKTGIDSFGGSSGLTAQLIIRALNASTRLLKHADVNGFSHDKQKKHDIADVVTDGIIDIGWNPRYQLIMENRSITYPHWHSGLVVVTQSRGYASQLSNIRSIIDIRDQYGVYVIILITLGFFRCFEGRTLMPAILNTLRIICNSPLPKISSTYASKIYLASLFLFTITIQVVYQGKLASLLMKRDLLPDVNTKKDLIKAGHRIYGYKSLARYFNVSDFEGRFIALEHFECIQYVLNDSSAACVEDREFVIDDAINKKLHLSSEIIVGMSIVYVIRPDWPLKQRLNKILASLTEADIIRHHSMEKYRKSSDLFEFNEKLKRIEKFRVMKLNDLTFAFVILGVGLGCATICFFIELTVKRAYP